MLETIRAAILDEKAKCSVIYHAGCMDGFGAAWAAWTALGEGRADFYPAFHGQFDPLELKGDYCFILDFAFPLETLIQMERNFKHVVVLDHHKTAEAALTDFPSAIFDNNRSGAGITWDSFHQDDEGAFGSFGCIQEDCDCNPGIRPDLINYIEDRDLWLNKLDDTNEVSCCVMMLEHDFKKWSHFAEVLGDNTTRHQIVERGSAMLEFERFLVEKRAENPRIVRIGQHDVPVVNSIPEMRSDLGNVLAKDRPFAVVWNQSRDGKFIYSLRSTPGSGVDVSEIAKSHGGGGHKHAAGFSSDTLLW